MTKPRYVAVNIPFSGFYHSLWSGILDQQEELFVENEMGQEGPKELWLTRDEIQDALYSSVDYRKSYEDIAESYAIAYVAWAKEQLGFDIRGVYESMDSPREYNFTTDRLYLNIPISVMRRLFQISKKEEHVRLESEIIRRFTSYDGFISHYRTNIDRWTEKPLDQWDHNELGTLLRAMTGELDSYDLYEQVNENSWEAFDKALDWSKYQEKISELKKDKLESYLADNPEYVPPYRCDKTPDMFA
jgi:hypothetical protein